MNDPKMYYLRIDEYDTFYIRDTEDELEICVGNEEHIKYDNVVEIINLLNKLCKEKCILKDMIAKERMTEWYRHFVNEVTVDDTIWYHPFVGETTFDELVNIIKEQKKDVINNIEYEVEDILRQTGW